MDAYLIMDGQWGSCGKGLLAGKLALDRKPDVVVCNFGPNAGHTFIGRDGVRIVTRQVPTGMVYEDAVLLIGPGAVVDPTVLADELDRFSGPYRVDRRLMIHERAAVVLPSDREAETQLQCIASTRKGVGAALARKVMRHHGAVSPAIARDYFSGDSELSHLVVSDKQYREILLGAALVQIESAQGLELSLNHGSHYPHCTSRDVTPEAILNDVGVPLRCLVETDVVVRTYPIRVGNEVDEVGNLIGYSGPVYRDMQELTWDEVSTRAGQRIVERTTVTGKVRRVFTWSDEQFEQMLTKTAPCSVMLNFVNYLHPTAKRYRELPAVAQRFVNHVAQRAWRRRCSLEWLGFGPAYDDVEPFDAVVGIARAA